MRNYFYHYACVWLDFSGIITTISVYRGKSSIYEYLTAGTITGSIYKVNMGLRGMAVGGLLGGSLGGIAGLISLLVMQLSGTSMEEVRYWQYKWRANRDANIKGASRVNTISIRNKIGSKIKIITFCFCCSWLPKRKMLYL